MPSGCNFPTITPIPNLKLEKILSQLPQLNNLSPTPSSRRRDIEQPKAPYFYQIQLHPSHPKRTTLVKRFQMCLRMGALFQSSNLLNPKPPSILGTQKQSQETLAFANRHHSHSIKID
jgi:hypothetical protein